MEVLMVPASVRSKLGDDASEGLVQMFSLYHQIATERFERRVSEEIGALRLELRTELHGGLTAVRREMADMRVEWLKWSFLFWIGHVAVTLGVVAYMLGGAPR